MCSSDRQQASGHPGSDPDGATGGATGAATGYAAPGYAAPGDAAAGYAAAGYAAPGDGTPGGAHRLVWFGQRLETVLDSVREVPAWSMTGQEQAATLVSLTRSVARLEELRLRVLAAADRNAVGAVDGATSTAAWLAARTARSHRSVAAEVKLACLLDDPAHTATREALATGAIDLDKAAIILHAVCELPTDLPADVPADVPTDVAAVLPTDAADRAADAPLAGVTAEDRARAEAHLVALGAQHDSRSLRMLAKRLYEVIAPEHADRREGEALEAEERRARLRTFLRMVDNGDGTHTGRFRIPTFHAAILRKVLHALTSPHLRPVAPLPIPGPTQAAHTPAAHILGHVGGVDADTDDADGEPPPLTHPQQLGQGFCDFLARYPLDRLPLAGGLNASVVVTVTLSSLLDGIGAGTLDTGERISAGCARRLACQSGVIPAVLGSESQVLDLGRRARLHNQPQRIALGLRHRGCATAGCDRPPAWVDIHHPIPWSQGGRTDLTGIPLCEHHHHRAHDTRYRMRRDPNTDQITFHRRT